VGVQNHFSCPLFIGYGIAGNRGTVRILILLTLAVPPAPAWNNPGQMLSGIIAYQIIQQENPQTIDKTKAVLEKHPWHANQWQSRLQDVPAADHALVMFMQAARWADDICMGDKQYHRVAWHYINWPFKPEGQPPSVQVREPEPVNILTALPENESMVKNESEAERKAVALAWLFHLVGDIHQPLHTAQFRRSQISISPIVIAVWDFSSGRNPAKHSSTGFSSNTNDAWLKRNLADDVKISH
jgi:hypothetical protein